MAYFSDTESSAGNSVQAGTLDLQLDSSDQTVTFLQKEGIAPGDSGYEALGLGNVGSVPGTIEIVITEKRTYENGITNKERNEGDTSTGTGELGNYLYVQPEMDGDPITDTAYRVSDISDGDTLPTSKTISANSSRTFGLSWEFRDPGDSSVNEAETDSVELDLTFRLVQEDG